MIKVDADLKDIDLGYANMVRALYNVGAVSSVAGLVRGKTPNEVIEYGAKNHFGSAEEGIPARPFLTQTWDNGGEELYAEFLVSTLFDWTNEKSPKKEDVEVIFGEVAQLAQLGIQEAIRLGNFEPVSEQTEEEKGSSRPLVDTGRLLASIEWKTQVAKKNFKTEFGSADAVKLLTRPGRASGTRKRKRKTSLRRKASGLGSLAKDIGYTGKGIRKRAERRPNAASGVTSRGVRRRGSSS